MSILNSMSTIAALNGSYLECLKLWEQVWVLQPLVAAELAGATLRIALDVRGKVKAGHIVAALLVRVHLVWALAIADRLRVVVVLALRIHLLPRQMFQRVLVALDQRHGAQRLELFA